MEIPAALDPCGLILHVRLTPKSGAARIEGTAIFNGKPVLKAHVTAPPEDGKANAALAALIAGWLGIPKSKVTVASGRKSRLKAVAIAGDPAWLMKNVKLLLAGLEGLNKRE